MKNYYNNYYSLQNKIGNWNKYISYNEIYKREFFEYLSKNNTILDLGCGTGNLLNTLERSGYKKLYGVEIDKYCFNQAINNCKNAHIYKGNIHNFFKKNNIEFDVIFMIDVLEHINKKNINKTIRLCRKSLKPNGLLIIRVPNAESFLISNKWLYQDYTHKLSFTEESLRTILQEEGFKIKEIRKTRLTKNIVNFLVILIRIPVEFIFKLLSALYIGPLAFNMIFTANIICIAQKK